MAHQIVVDFRVTQESIKEINRRLYWYYHTFNKAHVYRIDDLVEFQVVQRELER